MKDYLNSNNLKVISLQKNKKFDFLIHKKLTKEITNLISEENICNEKILIHCRGLFASFIGLKIREKLKKSFNIKVISDFRGAVIDEYLMRHKNKNIIFKIILKLLMVKINNIQSIVCRNSDHILCVSKKLEDYLKIRYIINCGISIIPTCIDASKNRFDLAERTKVRNEMNLENKFIVVYCGGGQNYQNPKELITTFININEKIVESLFLILTKDSKTFETFLNELKVDKTKYIIKSVSYNEVYKYLSASDCGILLRDNNNVNKVASPTKFAEYINCNLPVFISRGIGDIDEINAKYDVCIYEEDIDNIMFKIDEIKNNTENFKLLIYDHYEMNKNIKDIISIYSKL